MQGARAAATRLTVDLLGRTRLTTVSSFGAVATRDRVIREHNAVEGGRQTLARLAAYLEDAPR